MLWSPSGAPNVCSKDEVITERNFIDLIVPDLYKKKKDAYEYLKISFFKGGFCASNIVLRNEVFVFSFLMGVSERQKMVFENIDVVNWVEYYLKFVKFATVSRTKTISKRYSATSGVAFEEQISMDGFVFPVIANSTGTIKENFFFVAPNKIIVLRESLAKLLYHYNWN